MFFRQILHEEKSCLSYMVGCPSQGKCATVDAQGDPQTYIDTAKRYGMEIVACIETHIQADHLSSSPELAQKTGAKLYFGAEADVQHEFSGLKDSDTLQIGRRNIQSIHTPGHTTEHISLLVDDWLVITGDTLFVGDVGRVDLAIKDMPNDLVTKSAEKLYDSIQKLLKLPDLTEVYPGHYSGSACGKGIDSKPSSTIGRERRKNPALQLDKPRFISYVLEDQPPPPPDFRNIKKVNSGKQTNS